MITKMTQPKLDELMKKINKTDSFTEEERVIMEVALKWAIGCQFDTAERKQVR